MGVELYKDKKREWRFRIRSRNGKIVADSGESYKTKRNAIKGLRALQDVMEDTIIPEQVKVLK